MLAEQLQTSDRGVSPVVGVILMVAITVILAAVIGTFVLDLGQGQQQNAVAGVDISQDSSDLTVTVVSMDSADKVFVNYTRDGVNNATLTSVGESATFAHGGSGSEYVVVAKYEGKQNVIQTYTVQ